MSQTAPLDPPDLQTAAELVPRLQQLRTDLENPDMDLHGRPVVNCAQAAMGILWEEWRDNALAHWNGYQDVWGIRTSSTTAHFASERRRRPGHQSGLPVGLHGRNCRDARKIAGIKAAGKFDRLGQQ